MLLWHKLKEQSAQPTHQIRNTIVTMYNRKSKSSEISLKPTFTGITDITFQNTSRISRCYSGINWRSDHHHPLIKWGVLLSLESPESKSCDVSGGNIFIKRRYGNRYPWNQGWQEEISIKPRFTGRNNFKTDIYVKKYPYNRGLRGEISLQPRFTGGNIHKSEVSVKKCP